MNNVMDPIKILICGGYGVGKTSIVRRLANMQFPVEYNQTTGINTVDFVATFTNNSLIKITLIDIGADLMHTHIDSSFFPVLMMDIDGILIVIDHTNIESLKESDMWLDFLSKNIVKKVNKYLLVHKMDLSKELSVITPNNLDLFIQAMDIDGWSYTVGHSELNDFDISRGHLLYQKPPEDIFKNLILSILYRRQSNIYKIIPIPFIINYKNWISYEYEDLDKYVNLCIWAT